MLKLHLTIADRDEDYVESLVNYLMRKYSHQFQVSYFTQEEYLMDFLSGSRVKNDVLLISIDLWNAALSFENAGIIILLSDGRIPAEAEGYEVLNKYQSGDKLVGKIIHIFSEYNPDEIPLLEEDHHTKIVGVYSPMGGVGKTSIAVGSCIACTQMGRSVFYLNFEDISSTGQYFRSDRQQGLSNILYYIKEKHKNLILKIEGIRNIDPYTNIHYFSPPDSVLDLDEASPEELQCLILHLKKIGQYDLIFIDLSTKFDSKNRGILELCDEVYFIVTQEMSTYYKVKAFMDELKILPESWLDKLGKFTVILNKYHPNHSFDLENFSIFGRDISWKIPRISGLVIQRGEGCMINKSGEFGTILTKLNSKI